MRRLVLALVLAGFASLACGIESQVPTVAEKGADSAKVAKKTKKPAKKTKKATSEKKTKKAQTPKK